MVTRTKLQEGVFFNSIVDNKFKNNVITIHFILPLNEKDVNANAIITSVFKSKLKLAEFNKKLKALYDASIFVEVKKFAGCQDVGIGVQYIKNRYTIGNENIAKTAVELLFACIANQLTDEKIELEGKKQEICASIKADFSDKVLYAKKRCKEIMFEGTVCALDPKGTLEGINKLLEKEVTEAYYRILETAQIEIISIGDEQCNFIAQEVLAKGFSEITSKERIQKKLSACDFRKKEKYVIDKMEVEQAKLAIGFIKPVDFAEDSIARTRILNNIYGGSAVSKLFCNVREKLKLCYYCGVEYDNFTGGLAVNSGVDKQNLEQASEAIIKEFKSIQNGEFFEEDVNKAKLDYKNRLKILTDSLDYLVIWYEARIFEDNPISPEDFCNIVDKVDKQGIIEQARKFIMTTKYVLEGVD
ncbi:MAG: M16 family metallopeptidase [Oscillospiraceae bacterium]